MNSTASQHKRSLWFAAFVTSLALPLAFYCILAVIAGIPLRRVTP